MTRPHTLRRSPGRCSPLALLLLALAAPCRADVDRLPTDVIPTFQSIHLDLDARKPGYSGEVRIEVRVSRETRAIRFHAQEMKLGRVVLKGKSRRWDLKTEEGAEGLQTATAPEAIPAGTYTLEIDFENEFDRRATSLYRLETGGGWYAFTQFEAIDARLAFPCFDEPSFKFPYQVTLTVPGEHEAVSNTPVERVTQEIGTKTVRFRRTRPLPSYLLAIATGPLEFVPIEGLSVPGRIVVPRGSAPLAQVAASMTPPILAALERYFASPYPYEKLDLIAVPEFAPGAMENPGAITYGDRFILLDPKTMSTSQRRTFAVFTAHELAHMWFGDLVTMKWWDDLWLNESFAEWMGDKIAAEVYPNLQIEERALEGVQQAMTVDARLSTRAIRQPIRTVSNLLQSADALTYKKGQATLGMFERWMGPETFRAGVLAYLRKHAWGNAAADDLWDALSRAAGRDLKAAMSTFLDQPGLPLVRAETLPDGTVRLTQRRFLNRGVVASEPSSWHIPVTVKYSDGSSVRTHSLLLSEAAAAFALPGLEGRPPEWLHPNAAGGYYRWSVEPAALHALAGAAPGALLPRERIEFLRNLTALLQAGEITGDEYLRLATGFAGDPRPEVVSSLTDVLTTVKRAFVTPELEPAFAAHVRRVLAPAAKRFGWERRDGEEEAVSLLRPSLLGWLALEGADEEANAIGQRLARSFLADRGSVDPSLISAALRVAAIRGDEALFEEYRRRFEVATAPTDRTTLLAAMGSFRDPKLRERALAYALGPTVRPHEVFMVPQTMGETLAFEDEVFDWTLRSYDAIVKKIPPLYAIYLPYAGGGCSEPRLARTREFFSKPEHSPPGTEVELSRVLEAGADCLGLRAREGPAVTRYLTQLAEANRGEAVK